MMFRVLILACIVSMLFSPLLELNSDRAIAADGQGLADTPWPMFGHDPQHTGRSPYNGPEVPIEKWSFTIGDRILSGPAIATDGTIYVGSNDKKLYAINPDGTEKWSFITGAAISSSSAIATDGTIYVGSYDNKLYAINSDGSKKWNFTTGDIIMSSPVIATDGTIYVGSYDNKLYAINPDGTEKWSFTTGDQIRSSPAIDTNGIIYIGSCDDNLYAINPDGTEKWSFWLGIYGWIDSSPVIAEDNTIYACATYGKLYAINPDGTEKWHFDVSSLYNSPAIATDGTVYICGDYQYLYAINPDGSEKWRFRALSLISSTPTIAADGTIYIPGPYQGLLAIDSNGEMKWSFSTNHEIYASTAIAADSTIYIGTGSQGNYDNKFYAITEGPPQADFIASTTAGITPLTIQFTDNSEGNITSWEWDLDGDNTIDSTEQNPSYTYTDNGTYTVSLTVNGPTGTNTETKTDYIEAVDISSIFAQIQSAVSYLRELSPLEETILDDITSDEMRQMIQDENEGENIEDIYITQDILVLMDLMEEDQDLYQILMDLYSEGTAGFYDSGTKTIYVIGDIGQINPDEEKTLAHEYTHALQDQYFDLSSLGLENEDNSDLSMAIRSLVEGDASLLGEIYYWLAFSDAQRQTYDEETGELNPEFEAFLESIPDVLLQEFIFPYTAGQNFVFTIWQNGGGWQEGGGWDAVNDIYSNLPQSTEQILHPERYTSHDEPQAVTLPDIESALGGTWSQLYTDVLGELDTILYLNAFLDMDLAKEAAEGWGGDRYAYLKDASDNKLLVINSVWDTTANADEFFDAYVAFVQEKSGGDYTLSLDEIGKRWWRSDGISLYLGLQGSEVLVIIAPDDTTAGEVLSEFPEFYTVPEADFSASITQAIVGQSIEFTDSSSGDIISWSWDFDNDSVVDNTNQETSYFYTDPGIYTVSLTVSDSAISDTETKMEYIQVEAAPKADFSADKTKVPKGQTVQFTNVSSGGVAPLTYEWDFDNDGTVDSTAESPSYSYSTPGIYTVVMKITDSANNTDIKAKVDCIIVSSENGLPFWIWIVVGIGAVAIVGGIVYLLSRRRLAG